MAASSHYSSKEGLSISITRLIIENYIELYIKKKVSWNLAFVITVEGSFSESSI